MTAPVPIVVQKAATAPIAVGGSSAATMVRSPPVAGASGGGGGAWLATQSAGSPPGLRSSAFATVDSPAAQPPARSSTGGGPSLTSPTGGAPPGAFCGSVGSTTSSGRYDDAERRIQLQQASAAPPPRPSYLSRPSSQASSTPGTPRTAGLVTTVTAGGSEKTEQQRNREQLLARLQASAPTTDASQLRQSTSRDNLAAGDHATDPHNASTTSASSVTVGSLRSAPIALARPHGGGQGDDPSTPMAGSLPRSLSGRPAFGSVSIGAGAALPPTSSSRPGSSQSRFSHNPYAQQQQAAGGSGTSVPIAVGGHSASSEHEGGFSSPPGYHAGLGQQYPPSSSSAPYPVLMSRSPPNFGIPVFQQPGNGQQPYVGSPSQHRGPGATLSPQAPQASQQQQQQPPPPGYAAATTTSGRTTPQAAPPPSGPIRSNLIDAFSSSD